MGRAVEHSTLPLGSGKVWVVAGVELDNPVEEEVVGRLGRPLDGTEWKTGDTFAGAGGVMGDAVRFPASLTGMKLGSAQTDLW